MRGIRNPRALSVLARLPERGVRGCAILIPSHVQRNSYSGAAGRGGRRGFGVSESGEKTLSRDGEEQRQGDGLQQEELNRWIERWKRGARPESENAVSKPQQQAMPAGVGQGRGPISSPRMDVARDVDGDRSGASPESQGRGCLSLDSAWRAGGRGEGFSSPLGASLFPLSRRDDVEATISGNGSVDTSKVDDASIGSGGKFSDHEKVTEAKSINDPSNNEDVHQVPREPELSVVEKLLAELGQSPSQTSPNPESNLKYKLSLQMRVATQQPPDCDSQKISRPHWTKISLPSYPPWRQNYLSPLFARNFSASPEAVADQEKLDPFSLVADEMALLGNKLRSMVSAEVPMLAEAAEYFFKLGVEGKRFRPMVLLLMASSLTADDAGEITSSLNQRARQQRIAEITEMIHVASLLHDDVLDHADTRRGIGSLNHIVGNKLAVLAGDFLLARASVALASLHNTEVVELLSMVLEHLVTGEIMQLTSETQEICSMEYYLRKTFYKTASLMANSCKSIAVLAEQPREVVNLAFEYGRHLGLAFQLVDDSLDFIGTKASLGKPTLSDLAQGVATAPVLFALQEHPRIYDLVNRKFTRSGDIDQALEMVQNSQGISKTQQLAAKHAHQAALAIAALPPSSSERVRLCRRALTDLTEQVITRSK